MDTIVLENRFSVHQKLMILFYLGAPIIVALVSLSKLDLNYIGYLVLFVLCIIYGVLICISYSKRGFIKINSDLYRGLFFRNKLILKKRIDLRNKSVISVLKFKKHQKFAFFSAAKPDLATSFNALEINILNDRHTVREEIITIKMTENADRTIKFLTTNFNLKNEVFSPDFS